MSKQGEDHKPKYHKDPFRSVFPFPVLSVLNVQATYFQNVPSNVMSVLHNAKRCLPFMLALERLFSLDLNKEHFGEWLN